MAELIPTCPQCGSIDVKAASSMIEGVDGMAECPNCEWTGTSSETIAAFFKDKELVWNIDRIGAVLLGVVTKHAAGPMVQVFEFAGLVEKDDMEAKGEIMRACVEAVVIAGFAKAQELYLAKLQQKLEEGVDINEAEMKLISKALSDV